MNQQTSSTLNRILKNIEAFKKDQISLKALIGQFEECIDELEEALPEEFYDSWNRIYDELQILIRAGKEQPHKDEVLSIVDDLQALVNDYVE